MSDEPSDAEVTALKSGAETWLAAIFDSDAGRNGGIVRRKKKLLLAHAELAELQQVIYDKCFHLIETGSDFIIICNNEPFTVHA